MSLFNSWASQGVAIALFLNCGLVKESAGFTNKRLDLNRMLSHGAKCSHLNKSEYVRLRYSEKLIIGLTEGLFSRRDLPMYLITIATMI